jgi:hypothetical protein
MPSRSPVGTASSKRVTAATVAGALAVAGGNSSGNGNGNENEQIHHTPPSSVFRAANGPGTSAMVIGGVTSTANNTSQIGTTASTRIQVVAPASPSSTNSVLELAIIEAATSNATPGTTTTNAIAPGVSSSSAASSASPIAGQPAQSASSNTINGRRSLSQKKQLAGPVVSTLHVDKSESSPLRSPSVPDASPASIAIAVATSSPVVANAAVTTGDDSSPSATSGPTRVQTGPQWATTRTTLKDSGDKSFESSEPHTGNQIRKQSSASRNSRVAPAQSNTSKEVTFTDAAVNDATVTPKPSKLLLPNSPSNTGVYAPSDGTASGSGGKPSKLIAATSNAAPSRGGVRTMTSPIAAVAASPTAPKESHPHKKPFIVHPDSPMYRWWLIICTAVIVSNMWSVPFRLSVGYNRVQGDFTAFTVTDILFDLVYIANIFVKLRLAFYRRGALVSKLDQIWKNYFGFELFFDIISIIPIDWILLLAGQPQRAVFMRLTRLLQFLMVARYLNELELSPDVNVTVLRLSKTTLFYLLVSHLIGCAWFSFAVPDNFGPLYDPNSTDLMPWLPTQNILEHSYLSQYFRALFYGLATLSDRIESTDPSTIGQIAFMLMTQLLGVLLLAYLIGNIAFAIEDANAAFMKFRQKLDYVQRFMSLKKLPKPLQERYE